jgi:hypothetical protein
MKQRMKEWMIVLVFLGVVSGVEGREMRTDRPDTTESLEAVGVFGGEDGVEVYGNAGVTWEVRRDWVWDAGVRVGLTAAAVDFSPFVGLSVRF